MEETSESLLSEWGMLDILPDCERLGIDIEALRYMQEEDLRILVPDYRLGIRIKLRQRLKEWKERKPANSIHDLSLKVRSMIISLHTKGYTRGEISQKLNLNVSLGSMSKKKPKKSGGGGSMTCYNCNETGHMSRECPTKKSGGGGNTTCYNCNETGHMSRECPKKSGGRGGGDITCYRCNEVGHTTRDCPQPNTMKCFGCQGVGHSMRDCPDGQKNNSCLKCGSNDHRYKDCPDQSGGFKFADCFVCKEKGHISRDCPQNKDKGCFNCKETSRKNEQQPPLS